MVHSGLWLRMANWLTRQDAFTESYLSSQKSYVFSDVGVLIYVFDVESSDFSSAERPPPGYSGRDLQTFGSIISALAEYSPRARIFALVHKMDLVAGNYRPAVLQDKTKAIRARSGPFLANLGIYPTSIWDESLYRAWGSIVHSLLPNLDMIELRLGDLQAVIEAEEVVLFEQNTFLSITRVGSDAGDENPNTDRYERMSNIVKTFKSSLA